MSRQPRLSITHQLHHVLLRGNGREQVLTDEPDRQAFTALLVQHAQAQGVALHAWALMPDHIHLLATPLRDGALSVCMQAVGRAHVQAFNRRHGRRGTLWEGRYRSTVLEADVWLLPAMVWLDTHPQRLPSLLQLPRWPVGGVGVAMGVGMGVGMGVESGVAMGEGPDAGAHPWVTAAHYLGLSAIKGLAVPPQYWALGNTPFAREAAYRTLLVQGCDARAQAALADAALKGWALGSEAFVAALQQGTERRLQKGKPGRPVAALAARPK